MVQGSSKLPHQVSSIIEQFLVELGSQLKSMKKNELDQIKLGVLDNLHENAKSLKKKGDLLWGHIFNQDLAFQDREAAAQQITKLGIEVSFYMNIRI